LNMATPLPDHTGWQVTPTIHKKPDGTAIDLSNVYLPSPYTVCIIGASRGIGAAIAYAYAMAGATGILITGRDLAALEEVAGKTRSHAKSRAQHDLTVHTAKCEVTSESDLQALKQQIASPPHEGGFGGRLDVLVVNAGLWGNTEIRVTEGSTSQFRDVVNIDFVGCYLAAHYLIPLLLATDGGAKAFLAISGGGAWVVDGPVAHAAHCVSKLAQVRLVEHMANDFRDEGLFVSAVHPGCVWTDTSKLAPDFFWPCKLRFPLIVCPYDLLHHCAQPWNELIGNLID